MEGRAGSKETDIPVAVAVAVVAVAGWSSSKREDNGLITVWSKRAVLPEGQAAVRAAQVRNPVLPASPVNPEPSSRAVSD